MSEYCADSCNPRRLNYKSQNYIMPFARTTYCRNSITYFEMNITLMRIKIVKITDYLHQTMILSSEDSLLYLINQFI